jgi:F-type H+-transporting ATPase subunit a
MKQIEPEILFSVGPVGIADSVVITWCGMAVAIVLGYAAGKRLTLYPRKWQNMLEAAVEAVNSAIEEVMERDPWPFMPVIFTLWFSIGAANLTGIVPGLISPTRDISTAAALAALVFCTLLRHQVHGPVQLHEALLRARWILFPFLL